MTYWSSQMIEEYNNYQFQLYKLYEQPDSYGYLIYTNSNPVISDYIPAKELFESEQSALFVSIGHINLLEKGEG